jgi:hypothetical protein
MQNNSSNHLVKLDRIIKILKDSNLQNEARELALQIEGSFTGTELCAKSGFLLVEFKKNQKIVEVIGKEIDDFLYYCSKNGIHIMP